MNARETVQCEEIWLQFKNYQVLPLNPRLDGRIDIERAITQGIPACPDSHRADFYDVELDGGWAYVHVRDDLQTVYVVAYFRAPAARELLAIS